MCEYDPHYTTFGTAPGGAAQALGNASKGRKARPMGLLAAANRKPARNVSMKQKPPTRGKRH